MSLKKEIRDLWDSYYLRARDDVKDTKGVFDLEDVGQWFNGNMMQLQDAIAQMLIAVKAGTLPSAENRQRLEELEEFYRLLDFTTETANQVTRIDSAHMIRIPNEKQEQRQLEMFGEVRLFDPDAYLVVSDNKRVNTEETQIAQFEESHRHTLAEYDKIIADTERAKSIRQAHDDSRRNAWARRYKTWGELERTVYGYRNPPEH